MFMNNKRLLLTLYRLEEGQQEILSRLDAMEGKATPLSAEKRGQEDDKWIIDGIEAILSYRRDKEVKQ